MRAAALAGTLALSLSACAQLTEAGGPVPPLAPLDQLTVTDLRAEGDDPTAVRPVEHFLLPSGQTDPAGLEAALLDAGFEAVRLDRVPRQETVVIFTSDARDRTLARQIEWLRTNAPAFGFRHTGWATDAQVAAQVPAAPPEPVEAL